VCQNKLSLLKAIEAYKNKLKKVYESDPTRIERDARAVREVSHDYSGRWFFELLQNADDAQATWVKVIVTDRAVYIADNGQGLSPQSVDAICGTHYSDKTEHTIGRKGLGFKSVYELTGTPYIYTINGEGLMFDLDKARQWLEAELGFEIKDVPYQWVPFFVSRIEAEQQDQFLKSLHNFSSVVFLPLTEESAHEKVPQTLKEFPATTLLTLQHLERLEN